MMDDINVLPADSYQEFLSKRVRYVTYLEDGTLDGCYLQVPPESHVTRLLPIAEADALNWRGYQANAARDGLEPAPVVVPATPQALVPQAVAMWQARYILIEDDLLDDVLGVLAAIPDEKARKLAQAKFEYSSTVRRDDPLVTEAIPALGKTEEEIDQMFIRASQL